MDKIYDDICTAMILEGLSKEAHKIMQENASIDKISEMLDPDDSPRIITLVSANDRFKVVSCRKPDKIDIDNFWLEKYLFDYEAYLDFLYIYDAEEVDDLVVSLEDFEVVLKALAYCYNYKLIRNRMHNEVVKLFNSDKKNLLFYNRECVRPTLDSNLLNKVAMEIHNKLANAKNKPSVSEIAKILKRDPRPNMKINYHV